MPQITQLSIIFASQLFWLAVVFGILFFGIARTMVPKIQATVEARENKIAADLASAQAARAAAEDTEAKYRAARAYVMEAMEAVESELRTGAPAPGAYTTQNARLACTHGANACMDVVDVLHNTAGTSGMQMAGPLERRLRDAHGCATHRWVAHPLFTDLGKIRLGQDASPEFAGAGGPGIGHPAQGRP